MTVATRNPVDIINGYVQNLWLNTIDPLLPQHVNNRQIRTTQTHSYGGWSNYHALFIQAAKRFSRGFTFTGNYTLSKNLDTLGAIADSGNSSCFNPYDLNYCYGPSLADRRHGFNAHGIYELPFKSGNRTVDRLISGWSVSNVTTIFSGRPLSVSTVASHSARLSVSTALRGRGTRRPIAAVISGSWGAMEWARRPTPPVEAPA